MGRFTRVIEAARNLSTLGATRPAAMKIYLFVLADPIKSRIPFTRDKWLSVRLSYNHVPFSCVVRERGDLQVAMEVFREDAYVLPDSIDPEMILDLGAHIGLATIYFRLRYPGARIHAFEPSAGRFNMLARNVEAFDGIEIHHFGLSSRTGHASLYNKPRAAGYRATIVQREGSEETEVIELQTLDEVLENLDIDWVDVVKVDIKGAEFDLFRSCRSLPKFGYIVGELHEHLIPGTCEDFASFFTGFELSLKYQPDSAAYNSSLYYFSASNEWDRAAAHPPATQR